jgi:hypothetical protein
VRFDRNSKDCEDELIIQKRKDLENSLRHEYEYQLAMLEELENQKTSVSDF